MYMLTIHSNRKAVVQPYTGIQSRQYNVLKGVDVHTHSAWVRLQNVMKLKRSSFTQLYSNNTCRRNIRTFYLTILHMLLLYSCVNGSDGVYIYQTAQEEKASLNYTVKLYTHCICDVIPEAPTFMKSNIKELYLYLSCQNVIVL